MGRTFSANCQFSDNVSEGCCALLRNRVHMAHKILSTFLYFFKKQIAEVPSSLPVTIKLPATQFQRFLVMMAKRIVGLCGQKRETVPAFFHFWVSEHRSDYSWHFRGIYCYLARAIVGMRPPEGRGHVFNGPELLKEDPSDTEPCSHVYIISHCFR